MNKELNGKRESSINVIAKKELYICICSLWINKAFEEYGITNDHKADKEYQYEMLW